MPAPHPVSHHDSSASAPSPTPAGARTARADDPSRAGRVRSGACLRESPRPRAASGGHAASSSRAWSALPLALLALVCAALGAARASAQQWPVHFEALQVGPTLNYVEGLVFAPDGSAILLEKPGRVRVMRAGVLQANALVDVRDEVNNDWDRGLLGVALQPGFNADGGAQSWIYLLYTVSPIPGQDVPFNYNQQYSFSRLTRYRVTTQGTDWIADLGSREILLGHQQADGSVPDCIASVHNSHSNGAMWFGSDGTLLVSTGDGAHYDLTDTGDKDAPGFDDFVHPTTGKLGPTPAVQDAGAFRSQDLRSLAGKILRIDPATGDGLPSNPFWDGNAQSHASRVWALGLRNPFRGAWLAGSGSTDPQAGDPGLLVVGDVGWNTWEELNLVRRGDNFGWPCFEGFPQQGSYAAFQPANPAFPICSSAAAGVHRDPLLAWNHGSASQLSPPGLHFDVNGVPQNGFSGNCAIGGAFAGSGAYPAAYAGRLFFADYGAHFIRTLAFDPQSGVVQGVYDFGTAGGGVVDLETNPLTGEVWYVQLDAQTTRVYRLHHGANATPVAIASVTPSFGPLPHQVTCSAAASFDPEQDALTYAWDFGDGSPIASGIQVQHTFTNGGAYDVVLTVTDSLGAFATHLTKVYAGNSPPLVQLASPLQGTLVEPPVALTFSGSATDAEDGALALTWTVDLLHGNHLHPGVFVSSDAQPTFTIDAHGEPGEAYAYHVRLEATDSQGLTTSQGAWIYPHETLLDPTGKMLPISRVEELFPPSAQGGGNKDLEVVRNNVFPNVGSSASGNQFDSYHAGDQAQDDWIGLASYATLDPESAFVGLVFQEGKHFSDGGWFQSWWVEVRKNGVWQLAQNLRATPDYPFALAGQSGFDGVSYQTYELWFDPLEGDAIRLRGTPGGSSHFISCGELRARLWSPSPLPGKHRDISDEATIVAHVFALSPPYPTGAGARDPNTIRNGTQPQQSSTSALAQYDTQHQPLWGGDDWIGYTWPSAHLLSKLEYQEGLTNANGGSFDSLRLEVQDENGQWSTLNGVTTTPAYPSSPGPNYQSFAFEFAPLFARGVRLYGDPHGAGNYISVAELRAFEVQQPVDCGFTGYGAASGSINTLQLAPLAASGINLPIALETSGATSAGPGVLAIGTSSASLPLFGVTLLVDPLNWTTLPLSFDANGHAHTQLQVGNDPQLAGSKLYLQAAWLGASFPTSLALSNALEWRICSW